MKTQFGSIHFNAIGPYLKKQFGCRIAKLSIDGGFTCPNRDGTKGVGGCIYCSAGGSGYSAGDIAVQTRQLARKWPESKYIAYFQSYSNTYAEAALLRQKYEEALTCPDVVGLAIATRPDCLPDEVMEVLQEFNQRTYLWVELGLQTINDSTALLINRGYPLQVFDDAMAKLNNAGIRTVVHLIFGLPGESNWDMMESVHYVAAKKPFGVKFHQLYIIEGTKIAEYYPKHLQVLEKDAYISLLVDAVEVLPPEITIHRITGDPPAPGLIAPRWSLNKRSMLNSIQMEFKRRGSFQGSRL